MLLAPSAAYDAEDLSRSAKQSLESRIAAEVGYTLQEVEEVSKLYRQLIPQDAKLPPERVEELRALASLSRCEVRPIGTITSHRRFVGRLIVLAKKLAWPMFQAQLKQTFDAQQEFNSRTLYALAQSFHEITLANLNKSDRQAL